MTGCICKFSKAIGILLIFAESSELCLLQIAEIAHECFENGQILGKSIAIALARAQLSAGSFPPLMCARPRATLR